MIYTNFDRKLPTRNAQTWLTSIFPFAHVNVDIVCRLLALETLSWHIRIAMHIFCSAWFATARSETSLNKKQQQIHVVIALTPDVNAITTWICCCFKLGDTQGLLGYISASGATHLVQWLILVARSYPRFHIALQTVLNLLNTRGVMKTINGCLRYGYRHMVIVLFSTVGKRGFQGAAVVDQKLAGETVV